MFYPFFRVLSFFPRFILFSAFYPFFRVLSLFPRFIPFSAFYPFFRVLSFFPRFILFSAFYPFFRVLSPFPRFIPFSAFYPFFRVLSLFPLPQFRNSVIPDPCFIPTRISFGWVGERSFMIIVSCFEGGFCKTYVRLFRLTVVRYNCSLIHYRFS